MELKQRIINETTKLFATHGVRTVRMDDVAEQLGVSKRTIYEIFGDKESLVRECVEHFYKTHYKEAHDILSQGKNVIEEFLLLLEEWDKTAEADYKLMTSIKRYYPNIYEEINEINTNRGYEQLKAKLDQGVKDGLLLSNIDYDLAVAIFSHSIYGIATRQNMSLPENVSENDAFKYVIIYFIRGVATNKGIKMIDKYIDKKKKEHEERLSRQTA